MKCPGCGSNLAMEDERCSFCGAENPFAQKHRREMRRFTREFSETKDEVMHKSRHVNQWTVKITLCAVLVAACLLLVFCMQYSYNFYRLFQERAINSKLDWYTEQLDEMEENREYIKFTTFWDDHDLRVCDNLDEYEMVARCCESFGYVFQYTMRIVLTEDDESTQHEKMAGYAADNVNYLYHNATKQPYADDEQYSTRHQAFMDELVEDMEAFLQVYYGLTDEEVASFRQLSDSKRKVLLEEGALQYE